MDPFIGSVVLFGGKTAPKGWAFCHGQILPISNNQTLFTLIGPTYGGDGISTFALPDLRERTVMGAADGGNPGGKKDYPAAASGENVLSTTTSNYIIALTGAFPNQN